MNTTAKTPAVCCKRLGVVLFLNHTVGRLMRVLMCLLCTLLWTGCASRVALAPNYGDFQVKRIGILPFKEYCGPGTGVPAGFQFFVFAGAWWFGNAGRIVADNMAAALMKQGIYEIVEREQISQLLEEYKLSESSLLSPEGRKKVGELLGVDALLLGSVTRMEEGYGFPIFFWDKVQADMKLIDVRTGTLLWSARINDDSFIISLVNAPRRARLACEAIADELADKLEELQYKKAKQ